MTQGVGGSTPDAELARLAELEGSSGAQPLPLAEFERRLAQGRALMGQHDLQAIYLCAGSNLLYFTGTKWSLTERLVGAIIFPDGPVEYVLPAFEEGTFSAFMKVPGKLNLWQEHESPFELVHQVLESRGVAGGTVGIDEATPFHHFGEISALRDSLRFVDARPVTAGCRMQKSRAELALIQQAMNITLEVHKSAARILRPGIETTEVVDFIDTAHRAMGTAGSTFCAVQFGEATAYPHGVPDPQILADGDMVLIDTGCRVQHYHSDITRSYVFGNPSQRQREVWMAEQQAQARAFATAQPGTRCGDVDRAARSYLESLGYGPDYAVPGLPHRTGHGLGLDIHEWPYLVRSDDTLLAEGMCFSNEPMLCLYGEFGVRLEDHFYITAEGPRWFTTPSPSLENPFGY
ncbi:MAG: Xaa-Pro peptidase family protein [Pseudomonadota bacterium]